MSSRVLHSGAQQGSQSPRGKHLRRASGGSSRRSSSHGPPVDIPQAATAVLQQLTAAERQQVTDCEEAARYVVACNGNQAEAVKRLRATIVWRALEQPQTLHCTVCEAEPRSHFMHVCGFDKLQRPVIYSCLKNVTNRRTEDNRLHMIATFEQAIRMMPPGVSQWVWVSDFNGFGFRDVDPSMARIFLDVSANYYPERLGHFFVVDPPAVFSALWKVVQPWVDQKTRTKVTFCNVKPEAELEAALKRQAATPELVAWLKAEMAENRDAKTVKAKVYSYSRLAELAMQPHSSGNGGGHCIYGTPGLLRFLRERPQVLATLPRMEAPIESMPE